MKQPKIVLLIFVSGKVVLTGAKKRADIYEAFEKIYPVLCEFRKGDALRPLPLAALQQPHNGGGAPVLPALPPPLLPGLAQPPPPTTRHPGLPQPAPSQPGLPPPSPRHQPTFNQ